ncbi:DNA recombination protein RmuC [Algoriphagus sp. NF]|jgi:DNA recombination protein RmuC|uniref:DNA recombination protein RmuC n=1 Tax=Algoriphagus sp. NF TaxID=2992756 RepID=UPI001065ED97|nr:DNA recombination protein RmuC [Algoriphagus sp. NF]MDE0560897.1 DNA recombination protein RmuC [Algoriphagus sp. NF]
MPTDYLLILVLLFQLLIFIFLIWSRYSGSKNDAFRQLKEEVNQSLLEGRKENRQDLLAQFRLVFDSLRSTSRDQQESIKNFAEVFRQNIKDLNALQKEKLESIHQRQEELQKSTELKLERIRETVDEKLQKTLEARLGHSFELVSKQLQAVQKGLGEMQHLANGVGDLKRVLSNVKSRGVLGEYQLQALLENMLSPEQYLNNASLGKGNRERVEFAVKMPGNEEPVLLPIDAKFPQESYLRLVDAYDSGNVSEVEFYRAELVRAIKKSALDIRSKYLNPPYTTDFAILFLPVESLYAEVLRHPGLAQEIQQEYKVLVTGPTTLSAILNSLQMGFKTLAIQQRSSEVWQILGAVKTEFSKFGTLIERTQKKLQEANDDLDKLVGVRTRVIQRKLKDVQEIPQDDSNRLLKESE